MHGSSSFILGTYAAEASEGGISVRESYGESFALRKPYPAHMRAICYHYRQRTVQGGDLGEG